jgi:hypothetical protein
METMDRFGTAFALFLHWTLEPGTPMASIVVVSFAGGIGAAIVLLDACSVSLKGD